MNVVEAITVHDCKIIYPLQLSYLKSILLRQKYLHATLDIYRHPDTTRKEVEFQNKVDE